VRISWKEYEKALMDYQKNWELQNKILYTLCKNHPHHSDFQTINAKIWLIGRSYATGIERMILSHGEQGSSLSQLSRHMYKNRKTLDSIFTKLSPIKEPLNRDKLKVIVNEQGRFVKILGQMLRDNRSARSFASKYLHFHCPAIPIYDSLANKELRKMFRWNDDFEIFNKPAPADEDYYYFIMRFWQLYREMRKREKNVNVRFIDCYLLWMAS